MWWLIAYVSLSAAGLLVLGVPAVRVFFAVQDLARQVAESTRALSAAGDRLQQAADRLGGRAGDISRN
ncbi:hypothetical protein SAMN05216267_103523 [Actinacidiphila rubida]|uniref:Uncharacterized protein n=1 Tax=Actinacidiphila rubida TaxID=310780 RepID=A0A1H8RJW2_9ACTN|nr:hypothetical protein [Actinacidiphila rubida]SEO66484.1 hypothetical protein SAMN05216267_103523 [Actinacidiphila rubida]